jgi:hypothetical protein
LIASAQARWISTLTDLGGRNTLLYYKDRRAGTLDLAGADGAGPACPEPGERQAATLGQELDISLRPGPVTRSSP